LAELSGYESELPEKTADVCEFIVVAHDAWGERRASGLGSLAVNAQQVESRGQQRFVFSKQNLNSDHSSPPLINAGRNLCKSILNN